MKKNTVINNLKKATIEIMLLKMLSESDMYGYQLVQTLKKRSDDKYVILEGSMYPILYRLTDSGCISSYEQKVGKRQTRIYYHIEEKGREHLEEAIQSYQEFSNMMHDLLSKEGE